jgi:hypothetical protein
MARLLLEHGANPNIRNFDGVTALHNAVFEKHIEIVTLLMEYGADPAIQDRLGNTPLDLAKRSSDPRLIQLLNRNSGEPAETVDAQVAEIVRCYDGFYADIAAEISKRNDRAAKATYLGTEIPLFARNDLENFNTLLHNHRMPEIGDKSFQFVLEQATLYILFIDRYLFSRFGAQIRSELMEEIETGYFNGMMNFAGHNEQMWHYCRKVLIDREREASHCESINHLQTFYYAKCLERVSVKDNYGLTKILLDQIVSASTTILAIKILHQFDGD